VSCNIDVQGECKEPRLPRLNHPVRDLKLQLPFCFTKKRDFDTDFNNRNNTADRALPCGTKLWSFATRHSLNRGIICTQMHASPIRSVYSFVFYSGSLIKVTFIYINIALLFVFDLIVLIFDRSLP